MPLFLCRWLNGDCSVVWARTTDDAIVELDQVANAEGCPMTEVQTFQLHFTLSDRGDLVLEGFGEGTKEEMVSLAYPVLDQALQDAWADEDYDGYESLPAEGRSAITRAVEHERSRLALDDTHTKEPLTEVGRDVKHQTDMPTVLVDRIVRTAAKKTLKHFKGRGTPS